MPTKTTKKVTNKKVVDKKEEVKVEEEKTEELNFWQKLLNLFRK